MPADGPVYREVGRLAVDSSARVWLLTGAHVLLHDGTEYAARESPSAEPTIPPRAAVDGSSAPRRTSRLTCAPGSVPAEELLG
jgi:hypothetical protein